MIGLDCKGVGFVGAAPNIGQRLEVVKSGCGRERTVDEFAMQRRVRVNGGKKKEKANAIGGERRINIWQLQSLSVNCASW